MRISLVAAVIVAVVGVRTLSSTIPPKSANRYPITIRRKNDQSWSFLSVILGAAAACLLLYFFVTLVVTPKWSVPPREAPTLAQLLKRRCHRATKP
jgi:hypothetical protein